MLIATTEGKCTAQHQGWQCCKAWSGWHLALFCLTWCSYLAHPPAHFLIARPGHYMCTCCKWHATKTTPCSHWINITDTACIIVIVNAWLPLTDRALHSSLYTDANCIVLCKNVYCVTGSSRRPLLHTALHILWSASTADCELLRQWVWQPCAFSLNINMLNIFLLQMSFQLGGAQQIQMWFIAIYLLAGRWPTCPWPGALKGRTGCVRCVIPYRMCRTIDTPSLFVQRWITATLAKLCTGRYWDALRAKFRNA